MLVTLWYDHIVYISGCAELAVTSGLYRLVLDGGHWCTLALAVRVRIIIVISCVRKQHGRNGNWDGVSLPHSAQSGTGLSHFGYNFFLIDRAVTRRTVQMAASIVH